jgi:hypothetical protein
MQCRNFNKCITKKNSAEEQSTTKELKKDWTNDSHFTMISEDYSIW